MTERPFDIYSFVIDLTFGFWHLDLGAHLQQE